MPSIVCWNLDEPGGRDIVMRFQANLDSAYSIMMVAPAFGCIVENAHRQSEFNIIRLADHLE